VILVRPLLLAAAFALVGLLLFSPARPLSVGADYTVAQGDTLSEIAERLGISVEALAEANGIVDPDFILSGEVLLIPVPGAGASKDAVEENEISGGGTYEVRLGDTLSEIAERFGIPLIAIVRANDLTDPNVIAKGETLIIPAVESPLVRPVAPEMEALLERFAATEGLNPGLVKAVAYVESGWNQDVVSYTGAVGVMQIQPSTGYWLERDVFGFDLNIETSAHDNIRVGVRYLALLYDLTGDTNTAIAAYYQGYAALDSGILYEDTIQYVASVNAIWDRFWP
jgi:LysM repeat protein